MLVAFGHRGHCGDQVVTLETCRIYGLNAKCFQDFFNDVHLLIQDVWLSFSLGLVFRRRDMSKRWLSAIEHHDNTVRFLIFHQAEQHGAKSVHRICHLTAGGCHVGGQREERPICQRVPIEHHEFHRAH